MERSLKSRTAAPVLPRGQQGAVLYVALIMLILLALLGVVGLQVAGLQERMAANYRSANLAFQNTEGEARSVECGLEAMNDLPGRTCTPIDASVVNSKCDDGFDVGEWARAREFAEAPARNIRQIEGCIIGEAEIGMGGTQEQGGGLQPIYQISVYDTDVDGDPNSAVAIDTIFKL